MANNPSLSCLNGVLVPPRKYQFNILILEFIQPRAASSSTINSILN